MARLAGLYLDTARLGRMRAEAQLAVRDFARLAGEDPFTLYGQRFIKNGLAALSSTQRRRLPGLSSWRGVGELKGAIGKLLGSDEQSHCALANRSMNLAKITADIAASRCRKLLITDLGWPPYISCFKSALRTNRKQLVTAPVRHAAFTLGLSSNDLHDLICSAFAWHDCDGIFLPAVSHEGIRLPTQAICRTVRAMQPRALVVVDAAQAFAHVPDPLAIAEADVVLMGAHKWLGAGVPLGIATIALSVQKAFYQAGRNDPLLHFLTAMEASKSRLQGETVNTWPLVACRGALTEVPSLELLRARFEQRLANADELRQHLDDSSWKQIRIHRDLRSGIILVHDRRDSRLDAIACRTLLDANRIGATIYPGPLLRLSMPDTPIESHQWTNLISVLRTKSPQQCQIYRKFDHEISAE